jgi:hypothetical protein
MRVISNQKTIQRNKKIGNWAIIIALALFVPTFLFSFTVRDPDQLNQFIWFIYGGTIIGFIILQVAMYLGNRYGRSPRLDEKLTASLKGLTKDYTLYHYVTPVNHLLVGPAGVWVIETYYQRGTITYEKDRWKQKGGGLGLAYLKIFAQEGLGRPDVEIKADMEMVQKALSPLGEPQPQVNAMLVFSHPQAEIRAENAPHPALKPEAVKDFLRKKAKENPFPAEQARRITELYPKEDVAA